MSWFSRKKWEQDANEELRFHVEQQTAANIAAGMSLEEARRQATLQFGGVEGVKENCREQRSGFWLETLIADARYALRVMRKNPGFAAIAILTPPPSASARTPRYSASCTPYCSSHCRTPRPINSSSCSTPSRRKE